MKRTAIAVILAFGVSPAFAQEPTETPAEPRWKGAPAYPAACLRGDVNAAEEERVDVAFTINEEGLTEDVRIMRSTNSCFEEAALSAVRSWIYIPRRVGKRNRPQEDMEATFIFEFQDPSETKSGKPEIETTTRALVFDAKPIKRTPPVYPNRCERQAYIDEYVVLQFDVTTEGETANYEVIESTNECFNESALDSVKKWRYEPKTIDGVPTDRVGVITQIKYQLDYGRYRPEDVIRPVIASRLNRVRRLLQREKPVEALSLLEKIEEKYGDSMSPAELAEFHRMRGIARLRTNDLAGALDDLKTAKRLGSLDPGESLQSLIDQLEAAIGIPSDKPPPEDEDASQSEEPTAE